MSSPSTPVAGQQPDATQAAGRRTPWMAIALGAVVLVLAAAASYWYFVLRFEQSTDDAYVGGNVTVMAPRVNGFVAEILVRDNQFVHANQVLIRLDSRDYDAKLAQADAEVRSARAAVAELQARQTLQTAIIDQHQAEQRASDAELTRSTQDRQRYRELVKDDAVSDQLVERADADYAKARASVQQSGATVLAAQRELQVLAAQIADADARVATAEANRRLAALNVEYTTIRSPVDGYIGNRTARVGMLANVGSPLLTVVPSSDLWVDANFKEDQLRRMHAGDRADVALDASGEPLHGRVESLAPATGATFSVLPPENATGNFTKIVQRVPVRVRLDVPRGMEGVLRPGLSATVTVHLGDNSGSGDSGGAPVSAAH
ncbi:HlyD family secretion protein [Paraburkholderia caballeronis]|uniref:Membrane fusion protein, multidrug efflux system n=1 Tax=Paraburkholderia caballeronis TaxID=416943 RepID=A0A1H7V9Z0_9BURK|nr:HlyD family secretion protein [Paraburkholderia caballeronis]PXW16485.1 membrane fusion protein (multidrug efflux system) [Paraburkholderia caballeronis]PXW94238.1 membrane fusion protein (multidrug efflux system) [Paraburkholderia caballeronis]RAJ89735.1 membrane fusion protein (multidrug efflux system) [Paraburkholderia caballeronis]SED93828.1 membrane fusion protein, multidrug efflux system [Paraburkholderia caballeronis]SEM05748.1 membrane fusion protein, multidrug efflux system [Parabu